MKQLKVCNIILATLTARNIKYLGCIFFCHGCIIAQKTPILLNNMVKVCGVMNTTIDFVTGINHPKSSKAYPFELMQTVANSVAQCSYRHSHALLVKILRMS